MEYVTQWFNGQANPPARPGWYDIRTIEKWRGLPFTMPDCRGYFDGEHWEYPNYYPDGKSKTIRSIGWKGGIEWRGIYKED